MELLEERAEIPQADIVIGGPPCQGYSLVNKQREDDPINQQWHPYMEVVERSGAKVFVVEKVSQLLGSTEHDDIKAKAAELGFEVGSAALLAANCAVPQTRTRAFIISSRIGSPSTYFPPSRTHYNPKNVQTTICEQDEMNLEP